MKTVVLPLKAFTIYCKEICCLQKYMLVFVHTKIPASGKHNLFQASSILRFLNALDIFPLSSSNLKKIT